MNDASATQGRRLGRFQLRSVLLGFVVVATVCDVFLRPVPRQQTLGGTLVMEAFHQSAATDPQGNPPDAVPIEHGPWRLRTKTGRLLVEGGYREGAAHGLWQYYGTTGNKIAAGVCDEGLLVGRWMTWSESGQPICAATFASLQVVPLSVSPHSAALVRGDLRHGPVTWWDNMGVAQQNLAYVDDVLDVAAHAEHGLTQEQPQPMPTEQLQMLIDSPRYRDRLTAICHLRQQGSAAVPQLLSMVHGGRPSTQHRALRALEQLGADAASAIEPLAAIARAVDDPLSIDATFALLEIDPAGRERWLPMLFDAVLERDATVANELAGVILNRPETIMADLTPYVTDPRTSARRLCAALLLDALKEVTFPVERNQGSDWQPTAFEFGPISWPHSYARNLQRENRWRQDVATPVIDLLERMEQDADPAIFDAIAKPLALLRAGKITPVRSGVFTDGGFF